jgi:hypothetical protein
MLPVLSRPRQTIGKPPFIPKGVRQAEVASRTNARFNQNHLLEAPGEDVKSVLDEENSYGAAGDQAFHRRLIHILKELPNTG